MLFSGDALHERAHLPLHSTGSDHDACCNIQKFSTLPRQRQPTLLRDATQCVLWRWVISLGSYSIGHRVVRNIKVSKVPAASVLWLQRFVQAKLYGYKKCGNRTSLRTCGPNKICFVRGGHQGLEMNSAEKSKGSEREQNVTSTIKLNKKRNTSHSSRHTHTDSVHSGQHDSSINTETARTATTQADFIRIIATNWF